MGEPTLQNIFGAGASASDGVLRILLQDLGLSQSNNAEGYLAAILVQAQTYLTEENFNSNIDQSIRIERGNPNFTFRGEDAYRNDSLSILLAKPDTPVITIQSWINSTDPQNEPPVNAGVTVSESSLLLTEGGSDTYTIVLDSQPSSNVIISVSGSNVNVSPASLTFTSSNWNSPQTVTASITDDSIAQGNRSGSISHTASSSDNAYNAISIASISVSITDNDTAGIAPSKSSLSITEGASDTYTLVLNSQPTSNVIISVSGSNVNVSPASLTFTSSNWNSPQTVTASITDDSIAQGNRNGNITHTAISSDSAYNAISIASISVSTTDNDTAGIIISKTSLSITEGGATDSYTIRLNSQPSSNVVISLIGSGSSQVTLSPSSLTFTPQNWNTTQTVTVSAVDDASVEGIHSATISHSTSSADSNYSGITISNVSVSITDNDSVASVNVALASNGGVANASSSASSSYPSSGANNGDRTGINWNNGGGWASAFSTGWLEIIFNNTYTISKVNVFTLGDTSPQTPTLSTTFTTSGIRDFTVEYWNGNTWAIIASVVNNDKVWREFTFSPLSTNRIRVNVTRASGISGDGTSFPNPRIIELEAWT